MTENYYKWYSEALGKETEMLVFGHTGIPLILFPTSMGRYYQNKDFGLIQKIGWFIDQGLIKVYCPDSFDTESWYNKGIHPAERVQNHVKFERMILEDVVSRAFSETGKDQLILSGCSFGGYHAVNLGFKHPELVSNILSMSGAFNIRHLLGDFYDESVYFNNPVDFVVNLKNEKLYSLGIILGTGERDLCLQDNLDFSGILNHKGIQHWLDVRAGAPHDWPVWLDMLPQYLSLIHY
jgi:esterase/lipase superfamily enzyme